MRTFLLKLILFFSPLILICSVVISELFFAQEFISGQQIVNEIVSGQNNLLVGRAYVPLGLDWKREVFSQTQPAVITLGNSRVLQFRKEFFKPEISFFNLALTGNVFDYQNFLQRIPLGQEPKIIIVGLEQSFFNPQTDVKINQIFASDGIGEVDYSDALLESWRGFIQGKFWSEIAIPPCFNPIGLDATLNGNGFRADGSYRYGKIINNPNNPKLEDYAFRDSFRRIEKGINIFVQGDKIDQTRIEALKNFLTEAGKRNIHLVAFLPPYAPAVYQRMQEMGAAYAYLSKLDKELTTIFKKTGHHYSNFSDIATLGVTDQEFIDGIHGSEKAYLRILIALANRDFLLRKLVNLEKMNSTLLQTTNSLEVFSCVAAVGAASL